MNQTLSYVPNKEVQKRSNSENKNRQRIGQTTNKILNCSYIKIKIFNIKVQQDEHKIISNNFLKIISTISIYKTQTNKIIYPVSKKVHNGKNY